MILAHIVKVRIQSQALEDFKFPFWKSIHEKVEFQTIHVNEADNDEITEAGLTVELAQIIQAPRIAECPINIECQLEWHRPLYEDSQWHLMAGRIVHVAMDENVLVHDPTERMGNMRLMYNIRGTINPISGEMHGPNSLGLISEVVRAFDKGA